MPSFSFQYLSHVSLEYCLIIIILEILVTAVSDHPQAILLRRRPISRNTLSSKEVVFGFSLTVGRGLLTANPHHYVVILRNPKNVVPIKIRFALINNKIWYIFRVSLMRRLRCLPVSKVWKISVPSNRRK